VNRMSERETVVELAFAADCCPPRVVRRVEGGSRGGRVEREKGMWVPTPGCFEFAPLHQKQKGVSSGSRPPA
jgi:hypothetical protein